MTATQLSLDNQALTEIFQNMAPEQMAAKYSPLALQNYDDQLQDPLVSERIDEACRIRAQIERAEALDVELFKVVQFTTAP